MFQVITVSASPERGHIIRHLVHGTGQLLPLRELELPVEEGVAQRVMAMHHPDVAIVDLTGGEDSVLAAYLLRRHAPDVPVIGLGGSEEVHASLVGIGIGAFTPERPSARELLSAVGMALHKSCGEVEDKLLSFLPAKAGGGCSTVVLNTASGLAQLGKKVAVVEADLRSGVLQFLLDVPVEHSIQALLADSAEIDSFRLRNCVVEAHGVDWLLTSRALDMPAPSWYDYFRLIEVLRPMYDFVLVDLPELINAATVEFVRRSKHVFAVTTSELLALRLCSQRLAELAYWSVPDDRIRLVINRWHAEDLPAAEIEAMARRPVAQVLPNNYRAARAAATEGNPVAMDSPLGQAFRQFSCGIAGVEFQQASTGLAGRLKSVFARS